MIRVGLSRYYARLVRSGLSRSKVIRGDGKQLLKPLVESDELEILDTLTDQRDHRTKFTVVPVAPASSLFRHQQVDPKTGSQDRAPSLQREGFPAIRAARDPFVKVKNVLNLPTRLCEENINIVWTL